jgi:regulator of protease activity HflC (stomatin/prohibitin superfamily)
MASASNPRQKVEEDVDQDLDNVVHHSCTPLSCIMGTVLCGVGLCSCFTVSPNEEIVLLDYGTYNGTVKEPGCHYVCATGRTMYRISTKVKSVVIPETKTIDVNGNPLIVNGILAYQVRNSKRAALDVEFVDEFVSTQGLAALKQIVSRYPYEGEDVEHCLKTAADHISHEMVSILQQRVQVAGVRILSFTFNEISYAPEIASGMLKRQQAQAILAARKVIVKGATEIAQTAVHELEAQGIQMDAKAKAKVVSNLLTVICSETSRS